MATKSVICAANASIPPRDPGEKNCASHQQRCKCGKRLARIRSVTSENKHQRDRQQHFHEPGIVIVIYVRPVDPTAKARSTQPIQFSIGA